MSRIQSLLRPQHRTRGRTAMLPLTALAIACIGCFAYARNTRDESTAAIPATSTASVKTGAVTASAPKRGTAIDAVHDTIALVERAQDGIKISGSTDDIDDINETKRRVEGDFIWLRRNGQAYVVRDQQTIAKVRELWNAQSDTDKKMEALSAEMALHSEKIEVIGDRMKAVTPTMHESPEMREAIKELESLAHQQESLAHQHAEIAIRAVKDKAKHGDLALAEALTGKMEALGQRMESLNSLVESEGDKLQAQLAPLEALSEELNAAAKPMEALSSQMEALSEDYEREVERMDQHVRSEIDRAVAKGLAESVR